MVQCTTAIAEVFVRTPSSFTVDGPRVVVLASRGRRKGAPQHARVPCAPIVTVDLGLENNESVFLTLVAAQRCAVFVGFGDIGLVIIISEIIEITTKLPNNTHPIAICHRNNNALCPLHGSEDAYTSLNPGHVAEDATAKRGGRARASLNSGLQACQQIAL